MAGENIEKICYGLGNFWPQFKKQTCAVKYFNIFGNNFLACLFSVIYRFFGIKQWNFQVNTLFLGLAFIAGKAFNADNYSFIVLLNFANHETILPFYLRFKPKKCIKDLRLGFINKKENLKLAIIFIFNY